MDDIEIWPNGDIEIGPAIVGGKQIVAMRCVDGETGRAVVTAFNLAHFVGFADHIAMVATEILKPGFWDDPALRP